MDRPLGVAAGNANEIIETIEVLKGNGPADVEEVTRAQAVRVLAMSGKFDDSLCRCRRSMKRSAPAARSIRRATGSKPRAATRRSSTTTRSCRSREATIEVKAPQCGFIALIDTYQAGMFTVDLGAGRKKADDVIDYAAGVMFDRKTGDEVRAGDTIARIQLGESQRDADELTKRYLSFVDVRRREAGGAAADPRAFGVNERDDERSLRR